jgi:hypothetical protein
MEAATAEASEVPLYLPTPIFIQESFNKTAFVVIDMDF